MKGFFIFISLSILLFAWGENIKTIQADFIQTTYQQNEKLTYSGKLFAKNPNLAKWIYEIPLKKEIYLNANEVIIYEPLLDQATFSKIDKKTDFFTIITSATLGKDGNYHTQIDSIDYTLVLKDNKPYQIIYKDELDNKIEITLQEVELNPSLKEDIFIFFPNPNIDIIKQ